MNRKCKKKNKQTNNVLYNVPVPLSIRECSNYLPAPTVQLLHMSVVALSGLRVFVKSD